MSVILPVGWASARLPDLIGHAGILTDGDWVESEDQDPNGDVRLTQLADIGDGQFRDRSHRFLTNAKAAALRCTFLQLGDVMVARMPDPLGRACLFPGDTRPCVTAVDVCVIRPATDRISSRWLMNFLNAPRVRAEISALQAGSTRKRISKKNLCTIRIPIPPTTEQHRIVEAIESYFSRLDDAVVTLERVQRNLKRYRASVLKAAVEGHLVPTEAELAPMEDRDYEPASVLLSRILAERRRRWESSGRKGKYKEPITPDTSELPALPKGWCWATLDQLASEVRYGTSARTSGDQESGVPVLRMGNLVDGLIDFSILKYLPRDHGEFPVLLLQSGDLLFNRTNSAELVGKTAVFHQYSQPCSFASYLIRVRLSSGVEPDFVAHYINSHAGRKWIAAVVSQQVGQANVNGTKLRACAVPLPPSTEQARIVAEVDRLLSIAFASESAAASSRERCQHLRQSVLRWAFEGKLADQDPGDEHASVLLERIKAEREALVATKHNGRVGRKQRIA